MDIRVYKDYQFLSMKAAKLICSLLRFKPNAFICIASGESTVGLCEALAKELLATKMDFSQVTFVGLDEWVGMDEHNEGSCKSILYKHLFNRLPLRSVQIQYFDAKATDLEAECTRINELIANNGGLDLMLVGVGMNGHIALNEPGTPFNLYAHISELDEMTISVGQKYFPKQTSLSQGITLGLRHLTEAKKAVLIASGTRKAGIISKALTGEVSPALPASIFQKITDSVVLLDYEAASALANIDILRKRKI